MAARQLRANKTTAAPRAPDYGSATAGWLVAIQVMPQAMQKPLVTSGVVLNCFWELVIGQLTWIGQPVPELALEDTHLIIVGFRRASPVNEVLVRTVIRVRTAVGGRHLQ